MKKISLIFILTLCTMFYAFSQENRTIVGGRLSIQNSKTDSDYEDEKQTNLIISPTIGIMLNDKVAIGLQLSYNSQKYENELYKVDQKLLAISPFVRIHHRITDNLNFFTEPYISKTFVLEDKSDNNTQIYNAGITWGLLYFITQKMSLELNIAGLHYKYVGDKDEDFKEHTFNLKYDLSNLNLGIKYYF